MPGDPTELLKARYERNGWPAQKRPDLDPPPGWSLELLAGIGRPRAHALSPDGATLAFFWDLADLSDLYVMPAAGGWPLRLTFDRDAVAYWADDPPQWSPDGRWLAYTNQGHVWIVAAAGGQPKKITDFTTAAWSPRWMPDSHGLIISISRERHTYLLLTDREGGWPRQITHEPGHAHSAQPAPDGRSLVYVHQPQDEYDRSDICRVDLASGEVSTLVRTPDRHNRLPRWSPNGSQIAYISERPSFNQLYLVDAQTGQERQVTDVPHDLGEITWSPDGTRILCTVNRLGAYDLGVVDVASGQLSDVRRTAGVHGYPHWLPDGQAITFEFEDAQTPPDIYRLNLADGALTRLTLSQPLALDGLALVTPEHVTYRSLDGLEIPAFLYRPVRPNGAAVLYPHGGPTSQYIPEFDIVAQYFVAKGYTWLAPNFRGSTGYGIDFERANYNVWGVEDTHDCLAGADYLASLGVDKDRIAIFGASYGSYMTTCALAYDPARRFACGVAKYGDCDIQASWAQGDQIGREDLERMMQHPSANRAAYRAGSPVWEVDRITKPLLIAHGLEDARVHPLQSEQLVEALKREGKTFEYITYPDEGHGLLRRKTRLDFYATWSASWTGT